MENKEDSEFALTTHEIQSPLWQRLKAHLIERIDTSRRINDNDLDPIETSKVRATIRVYNQLLDLENVDRKADT